MTALLLRWQVIEANLVVLRIRSNFCHPWGSYATEGKIVIIITIPSCIYTEQNKYSSDRSVTARFGAKTQPGRHSVTRTELNGS